MPASRLTSRQSLALLLGSLLLVVALGAAAIVWFRPAPKPEEDAVNVPLGVEQAAIVTYAGPPLAVAPYKWGVAVNVRIAATTEVAPRPSAEIDPMREAPNSHPRVYDVRYIANRAGTFDLKDYLTAADGSALAGLPSFKFTGDPKLSKELDQRIHETEEIVVEIGGHYRATLAALALFWIVWLLLLIFYGRPKRPAAAAAVTREPTLAELLRDLAAQLERGALDTAAKGRLEMLLFRRWREELAVAGAPMTTAFAAMARNEQTRELLHKLEHWIHHRASPISPAEIASLLAPYTAEPVHPNVAP